MSNFFSYRSEIDGLRAVAVIPVMIFHAGFDLLAGGYLGVDIFFVISGYLITSMILAQKSNNQFSYASFYERRIRRIIPALLIVMLCCIPFAYLMMQPDDLENFGQSLISTTFISNNILLYITSGYWDLTSSFKPLLHTWSLGVEEQYYLIFPVLLSGLLFINRVNLLLALCFLTLLSFIFFIQMQQINPDAAFYLLPSRFWEIGLGACSAIYLTNYRSPSLSMHKKEIILYLSFFFILSPMFLLKSFAGIPGLANLIVCCSAVLIIIFADKTLLIGRILSSRLLVLIGLLSYSLYLWHQPLYAFLRIYSLDEPDVLYFIFCFLLSFPIAFFSWKLENFFRKEAQLKLLISFLAIGISIVLVSGTIFTASIGFHKNYEELQSIYTESREDKLSNPDRDFLISAANNLDNSFSSPDLKNLLILGDSFASDLINMIKVNQYLEDYEIVKPQYNCVNFNEIDSASLTLIEESELILITYRYLQEGDQKQCLEEKIKYFKSLGKRYLLIGPKDFGYNINAPLRRQIYKFRAKPIDKIVDFNAYVENMVPSENFINFLLLLSDDNIHNGIPLFTKDQKLISYDKAHLTFNGALEFGQILFTHPKFLKYVNAES